MHQIAATIIATAREAGAVAAEVDYDALTPESAARLVRAGRDVVPDYAEEAGRCIVAAALGERYPAADLHGTRIAALATKAWAEGFRAAWPAEDVQALADRAETQDFAVTVDGETFEARWYAADPDDPCVQIRRPGGPWLREITGEDLEALLDSGEQDGSN